MGNANRKASKQEMSIAHSVIQEAFPEYDVVFGSHGSYGGHRAPRDHTIAFRIRDKFGKYHSNVVWLHPDQLSSLTAGQVRSMVTRANGSKRRRRNRS